MCLRVTVSRYWSPLDGSMAYGTRISASVGWLRIPLTENELCTCCQYYFMLNVFWWFLYVQLGHFSTYFVGLLLFILFEYVVFFQIHLLFISLLKLLKFKFHLLLVEFSNSPFVCSIVFPGFRRICLQWRHFFGGLRRICRREDMGSNSFNIFRRICWRWRISCFVMWIGF